MEKSAAFEAGVVASMEKMALSPKTMMSALGQRLGREASATSGRMFMTGPQRLAGAIKGLTPKNIKQNFSQGQELGKKLLEKRPAYMKAFKGSPGGVGGVMAMARGVRKGAVTPGRLL